ncbi:hypothetical protein HDV01_006595 [Terramyces sp. JEL0728]|nr:hypothetical protein HDV01_006595 [Terramyces sp. JEL0728]
MWPILEIYSKELTKVLDEKVILYLKEPQSQITWEFTEIKISSAAFQQVYQYLPKTRKLCVYVVDQDDYTEFASAFASNIVTKLEFFIHKYMYRDQMELVLSAVTRMTRLEELYLPNMFEDINYAELLGEYLPYSKLTVLELENNCFTDSYMAIITRVLPLTLIKRLNLYWNLITDQGATELATALGKSQVEVLNLGKNRIGRTGIAALSRGLIDSKVKELLLTGNILDCDDWIDLYKIVHLTKLEVIDCSSYIDTETQRILIENLGKSQLRKLHVEIYPALLEEFMQATIGSKLQDCSFIARDGAACKIIARNIVYSKLKRLELWCNLKISISQLETLFSNIPLTDIETLAFYRILFGDDGMQVLAEYLPVTNIKKLSLNSCFCGDVGLTNFANCLKETQLEHLEIYSSDITNTGIQTLLDCIPSKLQYLDISWQHEWRKLAPVIDQERVLRKIKENPQKTIICNGYK